MAEIPITPPSYRLVKIRDVLQNPLFNPQEFEDIIDHFETRESDIFVCTYVKSGTTWTQQVIFIFPTFSIFTLALTYLLPFLDHSSNSSKRSTRRIL